MHLTYQEAMAEESLTDLAEPPPVPAKRANPEEPLEAGHIFS